MAAAPRFKIYDRDGEYQGAVKEPEAAACLVGNIYGDGATIRDGHGTRNIVFTQGIDGDAGESYDEAAALIMKRLRDYAAR